MSAEEQVGNLESSIGTELAFRAMLYFDTESGHFIAIPSMNGSESRMMRCVRLAKYEYDYDYEAKGSDEDD